MRERKSLLHVAFRLWLLPEFGTPLLLLHTNQIPWLPRMNRRWGSAHHAEYPWVRRPLPSPVRRSPSFGLCDSWLLFFVALGGRRTVPHFISRESKGEQEGRTGWRQSQNSLTQPHRETARHRQIMRANICRAPGISALLQMQTLYM